MTDRKTKKKSTFLIFSGSRVLLNRKENAIRVAIKKTGSQQYRRKLNGTCLRVTKAPFKFIFWVEASLMDRFLIATFKR